VDRAPGLTVRLKLTLSYAGFVTLAGALLLGVVWVFLLRYVPRGETVIVHNTHVLVSPGRGALLRDFAPAAAISGAFLLVFGLVGGWLLAGRMLAPLARITDATRTAATGSLSHRIQIEGRYDEFRELADAFDTMLARLEAQVAEQQRFAANASHELRTPLAIMQTLLDVARNDPNHDDDELVERLHAVNTRAIDLTEALLLLCRVDQQFFTPVQVDLSLIAEEATETLLPFAEKRGVTIETSGDRTATIGSEALLLQLTTNLVHNAIVHNLPARGAVWVTTSVHPENVVLTVENTGENLTAHVVATLLEPFQRATERIRTDHDGVGLGLAIVKSITQAHGGNLTLSPRNSGGLCVTVQLPAVLPDAVVEPRGSSEERIEGRNGRHASGRGR
jgi:two-component system, OmpR family, sensor histidine kinase VanS